MVKSSCSLKDINKGAWSREEDEILSKYVAIHGEGKWQKVAQNAGLKRCGKSCRQRWLNYLKPGIKRDDISLDEEDMIIRLHRLLGNRWALIAKRLPGRTDNEIKNYWNTNLSKKLQKHPTSSSWPLSASLKHNHKACEAEKTKQIHVAPEAPRPRRVKAVRYNKILENKKEDNSDEASLITDFLIDVDEKKLLIAENSNSKIPKIEEQNMVGLTNSTPTSSLTSDQCHLLIEKFDPLDTLLGVELKDLKMNERMNGFIAMRGPP